MNKKLTETELQKFASFCWSVVFGSWPMVKPPLGRHCPRCSSRYCSILFSEHGSESTARCFNLWCQSGEWVQPHQKNMRKSNWTNLCQLKTKAMYMRLDISRRRQTTDTDTKKSPIRYASTVNLVPVSSSDSCVMHPHPISSPSNLFFRWTSMLPPTPAPGHVANLNPTASAFCRALSSLCIE